MKSILIMLNILLAGAVVLGGVRFIRNLTDSPAKPAFTVKKRIPKNAKITSLANRETAADKNVSGPSGEAMVKQIVETDIFNQDRCPNGGFWGGGNARVEMTLVGTFKIGKSQGAVILQKTQQRNFPFMPFGGMMNPGGGGFPQRRMGIGRGNGGPGGSFGGNGGMGMNRDNPGDRGGGRRAIGGSRFIQANRNAQGPVQPGQNNNNNNNNNKPIVYKQYVRLGETMANGYTLTEIDRNRVVLTRGSDKIELELVDPSTNAKKTAARPRPANQTQIMQQMLQSMQNMQRAQMMQGFQMMRMNQQNMQNMQNQNQNQQGGRGGMMPRRR